MSKIDTTELGIAIVCGAVAAGLANGFAGLAPGLAFALGAIVSGVILMLRGYSSKDANSADDDDEEPKKRPAKNKNKNPLKKSSQPIVEQFQPEQKGKSKKKKKKGGGETSPAQKPASKAKKSAKDSSSSDDEGVISKAKSQTQAIYEKARAKAVEAEKRAEKAGKKAGEKAGEYGKKIGEKVGEIGKKAKEIEKKVAEKTGEIGKKAGDLGKKAGEKVGDLGKRAGERAGDLGKKAGEKAGDLKGKGEEALKKAAAAQKKAQAKARKEAQKLEEQLGNVFQAQMRDSVGEEKSTEGWEQITSKKQSRKDPKEKKPESNYTGEVRVAAKAVGAIIGKEGSTLKALEDTLNCDIRFQKADGQTFLITGEKAAVLEAKRAILALEKNGYSSVTHPQHKTEGVQLTDDKQVGAIAGAKGKYVKDIQTLTGAKIILPPKKDPKKKDAKKQDPGDLTVGIVGKPSEIEAAREAIQDLLEHGYSRITHPGWITEEVEFPVELLGRLIGEKGATISDISTKFGIRIDTPRKDDPDSRQDVIYIKGPQAKIELTKKYILEDLFKEENPPEEEEDAPAPDDPWQQEPEAPEW